ncbi:MAG: DUF3737 family protein [Oscillospiraceae bacterium]|nr:DUF3737 family protein [Oscillospiraceae bacterium]
MEKIERQRLTGERALFKSSGLEIRDTIFDDGESPLKESRDIALYGCMFKWKYPLWYCENITVDNCTVFDMGRAGIWYTNNISVKDTLIEAPKNFRRCVGLSIENTDMVNAAETLWHCEDVRLKDVTAKGDYFAMNCTDFEADGLRLAGNYPFDGCSDIVVKNSTLLSKDAFWNCERVRVENSFISGEYLGWNSRDMTFVNCTIESLQGLCYIEGLKLVNCKLINTTLAFEYSTVDAEVTGKIDSVKNPISGRIVCGGIDELIMDDADEARTEIIYR